MLLAAALPAPRALCTRLVWAVCEGPSACREALLPDGGRSATRCPPTPRTPRGLWAARGWVPPKSASPEPLHQTSLCAFGSDPASV